MPATPSLDCRLLSACVVSYAIGSGSPLNSRQPAYDTVGFIDTPDTFQAGLDAIDACLVGSTADAVVLAFRGTLPPDLENIQDLLDWMNDLDAMPIQVAGMPGAVHQGFWGAIDALWPQLLPAVKTRLAGGKPLYVTGHSKGGAMAHLAGMRLLQLEGIAPANVVSFAGARPGDAVFAHAYGQVLPGALRYEYADDIVPHLPPTRPFIELLSALPIVGRYFRPLDSWDYASAGVLRFIDWHGAIVGDSPLLEAQRLMHLSALIVEGRFDQIAHDHMADCGGGYMTYVCPGVCGA
ncbi:lipase family protein [Chitiniphilus purpureus]|uniref:Lipase family protein n=1 Tax=Chitiniphilus purpureus TaxID=2981137 RepID=A0ABY6DP74_9NEIS|nr:lipase family protein [Chitiniphilus sp. CD1]UXY16167.1 lipase family protein [Chitiniphilus sp. CD1]